MIKKILLAAAIITLFAANTLTFIEMGASSLTPWLLLAGLSLSAFILYMHSRGNCDNFLVWSDEYSVGIESMDKDHKKLLNLINNLRACILCTTGEEFERHNLSELIAYTRGHLKAEEDLLQTNDYPDYEGHKAQHDQMISYVESFVRKYDTDGRKVLSEVADYLSLWLTQHINVTDKKYTAFLNERGVH